MPYSRLGTFAVIPPMVPCTTLLSNDPRGTGTSFELWTAVNPDITTMHRVGRHTFKVIK